MGVSEQLAIRPFCAADQEAAKELVITGLGERWGWIDRTLNSDLNDIATSYAKGIFLVGCLRDTLVATGALTPEVTSDGVHALRVVRMSVAAPLRGQGIGRRLLDELVVNARKQGC